MPPLASNAWRCAPSCWQAPTRPLLKVITPNAATIFALVLRLRLRSRPCKPLAAFGQSCRTMSEIYDYREYAVACEVCNSDTWDVLTFCRSPPVAPAFMKTVVVETLDHGGSFGRRQNGDRDAPFIRNDQWRQRKIGGNCGLVLAISGPGSLSKSRSTIGPGVLHDDLPRACLPTAASRGDPQSP